MMAKLTQSNVLHPVVVALAAYESAVYSRKTDIATERLIALLAALSGDEQGRDIHGLFKQNTAAQIQRRFYTKVCAAIVAHLRSPDLQLSTDQFCRLCQYKAAAEILFDLSGYHGPIALLEALSETQPDGTVNLPESAGSLLPVFLSLDDIPQPLFEHILDSELEQRIPLALGWLSSIGTALTKTGEARIIQLQDALKESKQLSGRTALSVVRALTTAWMYCSYSDTPNKHEVKKALNAIWAAILKEEQVSAKPLQLPRRPKPRLVVAAERMKQGHAMHRSYASCLAQLRQRFEVHLLVADIYYGATGTEHLFDAITVMPAQTTRLRDYADKLQSLAPNVILYPSLGMSTWTMALCNQRFAPVQVMLLGHPAPAMSTEIDFVMLQRNHESAAGSFDTKVVIRRNNGVMSPPPRLLKPLAMHHREPGTMLNVAVNSSAMKLSARFISACLQIQKESSRPLHFNFFTGAKGLRLERLRFRLQSLFTHCTLHPQMPYEEFAATLSANDLALSAFPFGNTNSTVDTCLLGIPVVAYHSPTEVLSMGDLHIMSMMQLPKWLLAHDETSYCRAALRLINDDNLRTELAKQLRNADAGQRLFSPQEEEHPTEFVDAVWWIYENQAALRASKARKFNVGQPIDVVETHAGAA